MALDTDDGYWRSAQLDVIQLVRVDEAGKGAYTIAATENIAGSFP